MVDDHPLFMALKRAAARLAPGLEPGLRQWHYRRQMRRGQFVVDEPEFRQLASWLRAGDWAIDVGANVGHYTARCSDLVGASGRVIALEPVPETFRQLTANVGHLAHQNVTLINAAASREAAVCRIDVPEMTGEGRPNYSRATISDTGRPVLALTLDGLHLPHRIALVKIDVEGHEVAVLQGLQGIIERDQPVLIVEVNDQGDDRAAVLLRPHGYSGVRTPGSPNVVFRSAQQNAVLLPDAANMMFPPP